MVFRSDITVDWTQSPRLIFVAPPSTSISIQDLIDTLRFLEERPWEGLAYPSIIDAAGKEDLGGGVLVGITAKLLNARLAFEARKTSEESGSITTADTNGVTLNDSTALFITNEVTPGSWVVNLTDGSRATVLRVVSETQVITDGLGDGVDNQFAMSDLYEIQNVIQCEINGGNIVAVAADGITPISALLPTMGTQAVRTASSSATLQEQVDIQYASFDNAVHVNETSLYSGIEFPVGTPRQPVNNFTDALAIASERGFRVIHCESSVTLTGLDFSNLIFIGISSTETVLTIDASANVSGCGFESLMIQGDLDGVTYMSRCIIGNITNVKGFIESCILQGNITFSSTDSSVPMFITNCSDGIAGSGTPIIDFNGVGCSLNIRGYRGGVTLTNKSGSHDVSIDGDVRVLLNSSISDGAFIIRGIGKVINNTTGTTTIDATQLVSNTSITSAVWDEPTASHNLAGTMGEAIAAAGLTPEQAKQLLLVFVNSL
jgi:hypothetical protein